MSVSDESGMKSSPISQDIQVYRVNWLRAKARMDRWKEESHWSRMKHGGCTCGWNTIGKSGRRAKESEQEV